MEISASTFQEVFVHRRSGGHAWSPTPRRPILREQCTPIAFVAKAMGKSTKCAYRAPDGNSPVSVTRRQKLNIRTSPSAGFAG